MSGNRRRLLSALLLGGLGLMGCGGEQSPSGGTPPAQNTPPPANAPESAANAPATTGAAELSGPVRVAMETSKGAIELELDPGKAPISVTNFVKYAKKGFYDGTVFHRVIPGFMIQGGGMKPDMSEKPTDAPIKNEGQNGLKNARGTIAMARTQDPDSAAAQFFINVADNSSLDYPNPDGFGYAVFGKVTKGMDVADRIVAVPTTTKGTNQDVPVEPVLIKSVKIVEGGAEGTPGAAVSSNAPAAGNAPAAANAPKAGKHAPGSK